MACLEPGSYMVFSWSRCIHSGATACQAFQRQCLTLLPESGNAWVYNCQSLGGRSSIAWFSCSHKESPALPDLLWNAWIWTESRFSDIPRTECSGYFWLQWLLPYYGFVTAVCSNHWMITAFSNCVCSYQSVVHYILTVDAVINQWSPAFLLQMQLFISGTLYTNCNFLTPLHFHFSLQWQFSGTLHCHWNSLLLSFWTSKTWRFRSDKCHRTIDNSKDG